jgi:hypothetical protein
MYHIVYTREITRCRVFAATSSPSFNVSCYFSVMPSSALSILGFSILDVVAPGCTTPVCPDVVPFCPKSDIPGSVPYGNWTTVVKSPWDVND